MSFASKHNRGSIDWGIDSKEFPFLDRKELLATDGEDVVYTVRGLYINTKGNFDDHPVAILDTAKVDLPSHMTEEVKNILASSEDVQDILDGKVGFSLYPYKSEKFKKDCVGARWVDIGE